MALEFGGTKDPSLINTKRFERAAGLLRTEPKVLTREAKHTVETALDVWPSFIKDAPLSSDMRAQLIKRLNSLPIVREVLHKQSSS
jgi:serine/threonine-protein kinase HipA